MFEDILLGIGWVGSQQIVQLSLIRYLIILEVPGLYASQFLVRLASIALLLCIIFYKLIRLKHPTLNSPYHLGQFFSFSLALAFVCSILEFITIALSIHALAYYNIIHYLALFHMFMAFFRSWINNVTPNTIFVSFLLMGLIYLLEDWIKIVPGDEFQNRYLAINKTFDWQPLVMVIAAAASRTLGIWVFKKLQMKYHIRQKAFIDRVSWANYIADEPEKITHSLCVITSLLSRYLEAQLRIHCEQHSKDIEALSQKEIRLLIEEYFVNQLSYSFQYMESYKTFPFTKEAVDDPELFQQEDTMLRRLIKEKVYMIQLAHQNYKELFGPNKYLNLQLEILFEDYGLHEYIWDEETPQLQLVQQFFQGTMCFVAAYLNGEHQPTFLGQGYNLSRNIDNMNYYIWLVVFLGILQAIRPFCYKLIFTLQVQTYFFIGIFGELLLVYLTMIWIEPVGYLQVLGLIFAYCIISLLYRSAEKVRDQKDKLFYLSLITFLIRVQKFSAREGSQIIQMMTLCAEKLNLIEFMRILCQVLCTHGYVSSDQLRHIKFSHQGRSPLFLNQIPFIFQSQLRYENNIEGQMLITEQDQDEEEGRFERYIIKSQFHQVKSQIQQELAETKKIQQPSKFFNQNMQESKIIHVDQSNGEHHQQIDNQ